MAEGLTVPINVTLARMERELAKVVKSSVNAANQSENAFKKANAGIGNSFAAGGDKAVRTTKRTGFAVANLSAQLNDIGVSLAGGQSPFQVMIQQGTQVSQIFQQSGSNLKAFTELLKGAAVGVLNPFSLATFAIIGLGGAALQWLTQTAEGAKTAEEATKELKKAVTDYEKASTAAAQTTEELTDKYGAMAIEARAFLQAQKDIAEVKALDTLSASLQKLADDYAVVGQLNKTFLEPGEKLDTSLIGGGEIAGDLQDLAEKLDLAESEARQLFDMLVQLSNAGNAEDQARILSEMSTLFKAMFIDVTNMNEVQREFYASLVDSGEAASAVAANSSDIAPEILAAADAARALADDLNKAVTAAANVGVAIRNAYADAQAANQFRDDPTGLAGYKAGATFDRRVGDISGQDPIIQKGLANQRAEIVKTAEATSRATVELKEYRTEQRKIARAANRKPRKAPVTPRQKFERRELGVELSIDKLIAQEKALQSINPLLNDYGFQLDYATTRQRLLNEARKKGVELSDSDIAAIDKLATAHARATAALNQTKQAQKDLQKGVEDFKNTSKNILGSFITDLREGKSASEALSNALGKVADKLLEVGLNALFDGGGGSGGSGFFSILTSLFSNGGYTGKGPRDKIAGAVHHDEFVFDAKATQRIGVQNLKDMQRGFKNGGFTGSSSSAVARAAGNSGGGGDAINVTGQFEIINGNLVPLITAVSGQVSGKQLKQADKAFPKRAGANQARGI